MMKLLGRILYGCITLLFLIVTVFNLYALFAADSGREMPPTLLGFSHAVVLSNSMAPEITVGDWLIFKEEEEYQVGDIVEFATSNDSVTHRIVEETQDGFITRGDANNTEDKELVAPEQIHGRLIFNLRGVGHFALFLRKPEGVIFLVAAGVLMLTLPTVVQAGKEYIGNRAGKEKEDGSDDHEPE